MGQIGAPYATAEEFKNYQGVSAINAANTSKDAAINQALDAASRQIEQFCGRQFNKTDLATPRRYSVNSGDNRINVDDFWTDALFSIAGVANPYTESYYQLEPLDGIVDGVPGWPYYRITFPGAIAESYGSGLVTVTAKWGWAQVPATVKQATLIIANQLLRLSDAPLGVTGMEGQFGGMIRVRDIPQVASMLNRFVSMPIMVA